MPSRSRSAARRSRSTSFVRPPFPPRSFSPSSPLISPTPVALSLSARVVSRKWLECFAVAGQRATCSVATSRLAADALVRTAPLVSRWMERLLAGNRPPVTVGEYLAPGWLVRVRQNTLVAQRFDADRGQSAGAGEREELAEIGEIGAQRVRRDVTLGAEVRGVRGERVGRRALRPCRHTEPMVTTGSGRYKVTATTTRGAALFAILLAALERPLGGTPPRRPPRPRRPPPPKRA